MVCGRNRTQAHHLTYLQPRAIGWKVSDEFTLPLYSAHHRDLHSSGNERSWWQKQGIDPKPVASDLWQQSWKGDLGNPSQQAVVPSSHAATSSDIETSPYSGQALGRGDSETRFSQNLASR